jgi:hypothetical protein
MPYDTDEIDSFLRPYTRGLTEHDTTVATIVLLQEGKVDLRKQNEAPPDYLDRSFDSYIQPLTPDPDLSRSVEAKTLSDGGYVVVDTLDGLNPYYGIFNNFSLASVNEANNQIIKVHQNFSGYWNAFFFGESPRIFSFTGSFIDSKEYPYYQEFLTAYDKFLAGGKCIENNMTMKIIYDGRIVDGYIIGITTNNTAQQPFEKPFSFSVLIRAAGWLRTNIVPQGDGSKYIRGLNYLSNADRVRKSFLNGTLMISQKDKQLAK